MEIKKTFKKEKQDRLLSLDFFRGLTMFLLIAEFTWLYDQFTVETAPFWLQAIGRQFHHHPWDGLHFWDLIQPFFMFIVGVAMPYSLGRRLGQGDRSAVTKHVLRRSLLLIFLGWWLYCIIPGKIIFQFQDVLAQIGVTYFIAYLLMDKTIKTQVIWSFVLIIVTQLLYLYFPVEGYNEAFGPSKNFGTWFDTLYGGQNTSTHWVAFNAFPTAAHTIWGVLAGQLLKSANKTNTQKLKVLIIAGCVGVIIGYALSPFIPIIKRVCTASFVIVSGGWAFLALAFSFWLIDIKKWNKGVWFFAVVGMNPLFIYLFAHIGGSDLMKKVVAPLTNTLKPVMGDWAMATLASAMTLVLLWYLCYWLYKKKIFIKI